MTSPEWMTKAGTDTLARGYLSPDETPRDMYTRLARRASELLNRPDLEPQFFDAMWRGWLCPASPVLSNFGTERGLPISCFGIHVGDSVDSIFMKAHEQAMMSKMGGGVGVYLGDLRHRGATITGNGESEGIVPWAKLYDTTCLSVSQGATRRGAASVNLGVNHPDIHEFLRIRRPEGDPNRQCMNLHHCVVVDDAFMGRVTEGDPQARTLWLNILKTRLETGEPYIMFKDTVNRLAPLMYRDQGREVHFTNICSEIALHTDPDHSFVCCLSSLNLAKYDEWRETDLVALSVYFLEAVMTEFINRASDVPGMEPAVNFARKSRALGLGVLGYHTYLQQNMMPFDSLATLMWNNMVFQRIQDEARAASAELAAHFGEPEWCRGYGQRHTHLMAIAPTFTNSTISGEVSPGIEPIRANAMTHKTAKGTWFYKNPQLKKLLAEYDMDNDDVWTDIAVNDGSIQHLTKLTDYEREVFKTAPEINQLAVVKQAGQRQRYIDQAQSLNLFFPANVPAKFFNQVHLEAWNQDVKTLYYVRSSSVLKADVASRTFDEGCVACDG